MLFFFNFLIELLIIQTTYQFIRNFILFWISQGTDEERTWNNMFLFMQAPCHFVFANLIKWSGSVRFNCLIKYRCKIQHLYVYFIMVDDSRLRLRDIKKCNDTVNKCVFILNHIWVE